MSNYSLKCPDIGIDSAAIIDIHVAVGDSVSEGDAIITLESDKASMDVPADASGLVLAIEVKEGQNISQGAKIIVVQTSQSDTKTDTQAGESEITSTQVDIQQDAPTTAAQPAVQQEAHQSTVAQATSALAQATSTPTMLEQADASVYAGPATRRLARKLGVHVSHVAPTGPRKRVTKEDVYQYAKNTIQKAPLVSTSSVPATTAGSYSIDDFSGFGAVQVQPMSRLQALTAEHMHNVNLTVPQVTQHDTVDITELEAFRQSLKKEAEQRGTKLTLLPFMLKICATALKQLPVFNTSVDLGSKQVFYKQYYNIGFAADTPTGLLVPVVHNVLDKSIWELSVEIMSLAAAAKKGTIKAQQMQGGCFTVSSLGSIGGGHFTPIVNMPEVAILGVGQATRQAVCAKDGSITSGLLLPLSLSYDHRVINGADGARMVRFIADALADVRRLVLL